MTTTTLRGNESKAAKIVHGTMLGLIWAIAAFWAWFVVASHFREGAALAVEGLTVVAPIVLAGWLVWKRPLWGGVLLVAFGAFTAGFFDHPAPRLLLSAPLGLAGIYFVWRGARAS
jgi:hypothetical protein